MKKKFNIKLCVFLTLIIIILSNQKTQIKFRDNVLFFKNFLSTKNSYIKNETMEDQVGFKIASSKMLNETKEQSCFFSFIDDGFMQIFLKKNYCTSVPFNQYNRSNKQQVLSIKELKEKKPNFILFDIDLPEKYYSEGIRVEGDVRATIYNDKILNFIINNYSPNKNINGFFFWKLNDSKLTKEIIIKKDLKRIMHDTPKNLCKRIDNTENNCFLMIKDRINGFIIDVIYGNYDHKTIKDIVVIDNKLYFNKKNPYIDKFNIFPKNFDNLEITLLSDNINYLIKSNN